MWPTIVGVLILAAVGLVVFWFLRLMLGAPRSAEPGDKAEVLAPLKRGPNASSGAVALEEPDAPEDEDLKGRKA